MNQCTLSSSQPNGFQIWSLRLRCALSCARTQLSSGSDKSAAGAMPDTLPAASALWAPAPPESTAPGACDAARGIRLSAQTAGIIQAADTESSAT